MPCASYLVWLTQIKNNYIIKFTYKTKWIFREWKIHTDTKYTHTRTIIMRIWYHKLKIEHFYQFAIPLLFFILAVFTTFHSMSSSFRLIRFWWISSKKSHRAKERDNRRNCESKAHVFDLQPIFYKEFVYSDEVQTHKKHTHTIYDWLLRCLTNSASILRGWRGNFRWSPSYNWSKSNISIDSHDSIASLAKIKWPKCTFQVHIEQFVISLTKTRWIRNFKLFFYDS